MEKKVQTWLRLAEDDLAFASDILDHGKRPHYAAHFCQQAVEKLLKAIIQSRTRNMPARMHNFISLCEQAGLDLPQEEMQLLLDLAPHYIGARYPEDIAEHRKLYTQNFSKKLFLKTREIFKWLKKNYLR